MSSTNKTNNLRLNSWVGSDKPQRVDFNRDNEILDDAISTHCSDSDVHITNEERALWNSFTQEGMYFGNSSAQRVIQLDVDFDVSMVIVFANNRPVTVTSFSSQKNSNYMGVASRLANTAGIKLNSDFRSITVKQDNVPSIQNEYACLNENGVSYNYILFR